MEKEKFGVMWFGFFMGVLITMILVGFIYAWNLPKGFDKECTNPQFLGSEGIVDNVDLDRAFEESKPILGADYRIYHKRDGSALWRCYFTWQE